MKEKLSEKVIINEQHINEIRQSIADQYSSMTAKQKAGFFAKEIHHLLDNSLPNFSLDTKRTIRATLIKEQLLKNSLTVRANDIVEASIDYATEAELKHELSSWIMEELEIEAENIEAYIANLLMEKEKVESDFLAPSIANEPVEKHETGTTNYSYRRSYLVAAVAALLLFVPIIHLLARPEQKPIEIASAEPIVLESMETKQRMPNELPDYLQYMSIEEGRLQDWLGNRDSILADEPYFSTILTVADEFNIHPLLLFAITGQEQGFVQRSHQRAEEIANNPFNVFHSWQDFNTDILESSQIAARTIVNLSKDRPEEVDPIQWINRKYAEDKNWWVGVSKIFQQLSNELNDK